MADQVLDPTPSLDAATDEQVEATLVTAPVSTLTSEDLVEEVSIDGMCGVY